MNALPLIFWRSVTLTGLFGLIALIFLWNGWFTPIQQVPLWLELLIFTLPLALLIRGILHLNPKTHVYAILVSLIYMCLGCWFILTPNESLYGYLMLALSILLYAGGFFTAKILGKSNKAARKS